MAKSSDSFNIAERRSSIALRHDTLSGFRCGVAANVLRQGGLIAYPTEAVWGLGCDPQNEDALLKLLKLKQRDWCKGLILVAASIEQLLPYMADLSNDQQSRLGLSWPGPQTWIVPANPTISPLLTGNRVSIAVRVSGHSGVAALCQYFGGPIVSTSANPTGKVAARSQLRVCQYFGKSVDYYLGGKTSGAGKPSSIRDLLSGSVLRSG